MRRADPPGPGGRATMVGRSTWIAAATSLILGAAVLGSCDDPLGAVWERHPLPRLPSPGSVLLPPGFVGYDEPTAPYASNHPIHVDSAFFELGGYTALFQPHQCQGQITVSPYDPAVVEPGAHVDLLGTKLCDANWFITSWEPGKPGWHQPDPADQHLWVLDDYRPMRVGWFGTYRVPSAGAVLFEPEGGFTVGLWAEKRLYSTEEAIAVVRRVAESLKRPPP